MPRARQIKPDLFRNGELFEIAGAEGVLFFEALWTLADREGRLEDRPLTIKATGCPLLSLDPDEALWKMHERGFVLRYECNGLRYIQIVNFLKHQVPHVKELESIIPPLEGFAHPWCVRKGSNVTWYPAEYCGAPVDAQLRNLTNRVPLPCQYGTSTVPEQYGNPSSKPLTHNPLSLEKGSRDSLPPTSTPDPVDDEQELPALKPLQQFKAFRLTAPHYRITEQLFGWDRAETKRNTAAWQAHLNDNPDKAIADFNANWQGFMDRRFRFDRQDAAKATSNGNGASPVPSLPDPNELLRRQQEADERARREAARIARGER